MKDMALEVFRAIKEFVARANKPLLDRIQVLEAKEQPPRELTPNEKAELVESLKPFIEAAHHKWALDWEREATQFMLKTIASIPEPEDGRDGISFEHFEAYMLDDSRTLVVKLSNGEKEVKQEIKLYGIPLYKEIYKSAENYECGDMVTYGGSLWSALIDNPGTPGDGKGWRLCVKKGADGKK